VRKLSQALVAVALAACSTAGDGAGQPTPTPSTTTVVGTTSPPTTTTTTAATTTAPTRVFDMFAVPFSMESGTPPLAGGIAAEEVVEFSGFGDRYLIFVAGLGDAAAWLERVGTDDFEVGEAFEGSVGGAPATVVDVKTAGAADVELFSVFVAGQGQWVWGVPSGATLRLHLVDVAGTTVAVLAEAPDDTFPAWVTITASHLETVVWNP
jgi:hypothetical protein